MPISTDDIINPHIFQIALAIVAGLFGAVLGSTHPIASILVCAFAGALSSGAIIVYCIATLPNYLFGEREIIVACGGGAIIFAVLTLLCVKFVTIVASSIVGSAMIMASIDFFMHGSETLSWVSIIIHRILFSRVDYHMTCFLI